MAVNFWSETYFGVFNFGTSYLGAKIKPWPKFPDLRYWGCISGWLLQNVHISNDNESFLFHVDCFFPLSLTRLLLDLTLYMSNRVSYKKQELLTLCTWVHPPFFKGSMLLNFLVFRIKLCLFCFRPVSWVLNVSSVSGLSSSSVLGAQCFQCLWIVFVLCLGCSMFPVSHSWFSLRFSLMVFSCIRISSLLHQSLQNLHIHLLDNRTSTNVYG